MKTFSDHCNTCCNSPDCNGKDCMATVDSFIKVDKQNIADLEKELAGRDDFLKEHCPCDCCAYADGINVKFPDSSADSCLLCMASDDMGNWKFEEDLD